MPGTTGADTPVWFRWEDAGFAESPDDDTPKAFGYDASLDSDEGSRNAVRVLAPDSQKAADIIAMNFSGSFEVTFTLTDPWWLGGVFGQPDSEGTDPVEHTYDGDLDTFVITEAFRGSGNSRILRGCVPGDVTVNTAVPERVEVSISGAYADEEKDDGSIPDQPTPDYDPVTFKEARLDLDGDKEALVQDASLTITLNTELIDALDSDTPVDYWAAVPEPELEYSKVKDDSNEDTLEDFYGGDTSLQSGGSSAPMTLEFAAPHDGDENTITFDITGAFGDSYGHNTIGDPEELVQQEMNRLIEGVSATVENDTETAP